MKILRIIGCCNLIVVLSLARTGLALDAGPTQGVPSVEGQMTLGQGGQKAAVEKKNGLAEMREWLEQRNLDRKQKGTSLPESFNSVKKYSATLKPTLSRGHERLPSGFQAGSDSPPPSQGLLVPQTGRGADGRIHHRLIINEDGPDQLQVYSSSGYAVPNATGEDAGKLARLTPRGKQAWMTGSYLRAPASYYSLKPKGWNHPKLGGR